MKCESRQAIHMEKLLVTVWVDLQVGWSRISENDQVKENGIDRFMRTQVWHRLLALWGKGPAKEQWPLPLLSGKKAVPTVLTE